MRFLIVLLFPIFVNANDLVGRIWSNADQKFITKTDLIKALVKSPYVLLGEKHGFKPHQDNIAWVLSAIASTDRYPTVVMEMVEPQDQKIVETYRLKHQEDISGLPLQLKWADKSWPAWIYYKPIFQSIFMAKLPILAGDTEKDNLPNSKYDSDIYESWKDSMFTAHCEMIKPDRLESVTKHQIRRDQFMAQQLKSVETGILIAGRSHTRHDRALPKYLDNVVSLAMIDVKTDNTPESYQPAKNAYDFIWFSEKNPKISTCERLRKSGLVK